MLRLNRLGAQDRRLVRLSTFAERLTVDSGRAVSISSLSRWENGLTTVPYWAASSYERILGMPPGLLVATADTVYRYHQPPTRTSPQWARQRLPADGGNIDDLVDRVAGGGPMTAGDWDRLSGVISGRPELVLTPTSTWARMAERLLLELSIADGLSWMARAEAYHRLIAHPVGQLPAIATAAAAAADPTAQSMIGSLSVFNATSHPDASSVVVGQVVNATSARTFYGALLTSAKKLKYGYYTDRQAADLLPFLVELCERGSWERVRLAARLVRQLPRSLLARLSPRLRRLAAIDDPVWPQDHVQAICDRVVMHLEVSGVPVVDPLLPLVLQDMLSDPVFDVRLCAMFQLYATPYRAAVATVLGEELRTVVRRRGAGQRVESLLESLRVLGAEHERALIELLLTRRDMASDVRDMAAYALGHVGGLSSDAFFRATTGDAVRRWLRYHDAHELSVIDRLVYALGMSRQHHLLAEFVRDPDVPGQVQVAARWWLSLPSYLTESASS
jgi:hypothetical protein